MRPGPRVALLVLRGGISPAGAAGADPAGGSRIDCELRLAQPVWTFARERSVALSGWVELDDERMQVGGRARLRGARLQLELELSDGARLELASCEPNAHWAFSLSDLTGCLRKLAGERRVEVRLDLRRDLGKLVWGSLRD